MSNVNRRTFSLGSLVAAFGLGKVNPVPEYPPVPTPTVPGDQAFLQVPKAADPFYKARRIRDLNARLLNLKRESIDMTHKNLEALKSVSPNVKDLLNNQYHMERRKARTARDIINELFHLGDKTHGTPDFSGSDYYTSETTGAQAPEPY